MHMAEVTVVIPNYNGIGYLKDCLDTLREQTCKNYETVLVDNGSDGRKPCVCKKNIIRG